MQPGWRHHYEIIRQVFFTVPYYFSLGSLTANQSSEDDRFGNDGHLQLDLWHIDVTISFYVILTFVLLGICSKCEWYDSCWLYWVNCLEMRVSSDFDKVGYILAGQTLPFILRFRVQHIGKCWSWWRSYGGHFAFDYKQCSSWCILSSIWIILDSRAGLIHKRYTDITF